MGGSFWGFGGSHRIMALWDPCAAGLVHVAPLAVVAVCYAWLSGRGISNNSNNNHINNNILLVVIKKLIILLCWSHLKPALPDPLWRCGSEELSPLPQIHALCSSCLLQQCRAWDQQQACLGKVGISWDQRREGRAQWLRM